MAPAQQFSLAEFLNRSDDDSFSVAQARPHYAPSTTGDVSLSDEQQAVIDAVLDGHDVIVDATVGSGKTSTIQTLCNTLKRERPTDKILYLTYSKLLKIDAQRRVRGAKVQNYHGIVYPSLLRANIQCGISESIATFNRRFKELSADFETYDVLIIDEYQDITEEYAELLENIKSKNPIMQVVMVGDMEQRVSAASRHNAQEFAKKFCTDPKLLSFTQSFRIGQDLANRLGIGWSKPITGANDKQTVEIVDFNTAVAMMLDMKARPGDMLCLGKRNGMMADALNQIERREPTRFNKNTVFASIRDRGSQSSFAPTSAIFTTFDSSKGLERDTCFIFDYSPKNWQTRNNFDNADAVILRNVFLVAASRGKNRVVFVSDERSSGSLERGYIGDIPLKSFTELPNMKRPEYKAPMSVDSMFDFKYVETVDDAFALLECERMDDETSKPIMVPASDGLIDLTPVVNHYQKALFFDDFSVMTQFVSNNDAAHIKLGSQIRKRANLVKATGGKPDHWDNVLALVAMENNFDRYVEQVSERIDDQTAKLIVDRMSEHLSVHDCHQVTQTMSGTALHTRGVSSKLDFTGVIDAFNDEMSFNLRFVDELTHPMFLQAAMHMMLAGREVGCLWNIRTNERWEVRIPDRQRFLDAVTLCVTKQSYRRYQEA